MARARTELRFALSLRVLSASVAWFCLRARRQAIRTEDRFTLDSAARPREMAALLALAGARTQVVELGTGTAWSAIALAIDVPARRVLSYDPCARPQREAYLSLVAAEVSARIELRELPDTAGPLEGDPPVELLFIDSAHDRESVLAAFAAWRDALAPAAVVVFHDYLHPGYPGVGEAVRELGLGGREAGGVFIWSAPGAA